MSDPLLKRQLKPEELEQFCSKLQKNTPFQFFIAVKRGKRLSYCAGSRSVLPVKPEQYQLDHSHWLCIPPQKEATADAVRQLLIRVKKA